VKQTASLLFATATVRSGYMLQDTEDFGRRIERLMRSDLNVPLDAPIEEEDIDIDDEPTKDDKPSAGSSDDDKPEDVREDL